MAAARRMVVAGGLAVLLAAAPALAAAGAGTAGAAPPKAGCEREVLHEARADVRMKAGLPETELVRVELTPAQQSALTAGFEALVEKCPEDPEMRYKLYKVLAGDKATPNERLIAAAEAVSAANAKHPGDFPMPAQALVAQDLLERHLAPQLASRLIGEGRKDLTALRERLAQAPKDPVVDPEQIRMREAYLDGNAAYIDILEARLHLQQGDSAAAGQKLAAVRSALAAAGPVQPGRAPMQYEVARLELAAAAPAVAPPELPLAPPPPQAASEGLFEDADFVFEGLPLEDPGGKSWTVEDLHGKTWLVNLWATWCGPCMAELPHIQKLYDELKDRSDVGILTLNFDNDPKRVKPFLERRGYTFPVLLTVQKLDKFVQQGIPQNWLVDRAGRIRRKATGFDPEHPDSFLEQAKKELQQLQAK